jgi:hypothetical protein
LLFKTSNANERICAVCAVALIPGTPALGARLMRLRECLDAQHTYAKPHRDCEGPDGELSFKIPKQSLKM